MMNNKPRSQFASALAIALALGVFAPTTVLADENDPPSRAGRLAYAQGAVSFEPAGTEDWVSAVVNRPLTTGDRVWSDADGRAEVQLDGSLLRLSNNTAMSFLNLSDNVTQVQLSAGTLVVRVRRLDDNEAYEIDTPNLAFTIARPGLYRVTVDPTGTSTAIRVRSGAGEVTGGGTSYTVQDNEDDVFTGTDQLVENGQQYDAGEDQFDAWSSGRDNRSQNSASARYVSADVVGYEDLDEHGAWRPAPGYGNVWFPRNAGADWAPYHNGHWAYIEPWGYSWVDDQPWGFAPFHYGRWVSVNGAWGWVPSPPRVQGVAYVRPVYAPALVAWVGTGAAVAWFALGPREVYVPSYPVSRNYVNNVNVSNTTVNTTVVNNVYNTTVINNTTNVTNTKNVTNVNNVTNIKYVNQRVPGAITATSHEAFSSAQPVARNTVKVDERAIASAPVRALAPPITPAKQAVLGTARAAARKPPAAVQTRAVVAKVAPPPPPPAFEKRQEAIKKNGGKPLSTAQVRQIQPAAQQHAAVVKVAPPAKPGAPQSAKSPAAVKAAPGAGAPKAPAAAAGKPAAAKPAEAQAKAPAPAADKNAAADRKVERPANGNAARPAEPAKAAEAQAKAPAIPGEKKPADRPVASGAEPPKGATPQTHPPDRPAAAANSAPKPAPAVAHPKEAEAAANNAAANAAKARLDAQHQQEQAQLRAKQEQERQKAQQQQDLQRKQLEQQKSDQAKKLQLEKQQQEQAKQLQQKHAQEQQALQQKQQQEKQQAAKAPPKDTKDTKDDHPTK